LNYETVIGTVEPSDIVALPPVILPVVTSLVFIEYLSKLPTMEINNDLEIEKNNTQNELTEKYDRYISKLNQLEKKEKHGINLYINYSIDFDECTKMSKLFKSEIEKIKQEVEKLEIQIDEQKDNDISKSDDINDIVQVGQC
jgi:tRNA U34 5-carboxymethylaminomethyl modifying enzyme MnmG/GidA